MTTRKPGLKTSAKKAAKHPAKATAKKAASRKSSAPPSRRWSASVDTDSTHPAQGLFLKGPRTIANSLASEKVSPKGPASGMRMLNFYINRAGRNLPPEQLARLEKARTMLSSIIARQKEKPAKEAASGKSA